MSTFSTMLRAESGVQQQQQQQQRHQKCQTSRIRHLPDWLPWQLLSRTRRPRSSPRLVGAALALAQLAALALAAVAGDNIDGGGGGSSFVSAAWQLRRNLRSVFVDGRLGATAASARMPRPQPVALNSVRDGVTFWRYARATLVPGLYGTAGLLRAAGCSHDAALVRPFAASPRLRRLIGGAAPCAWQVAGVLGASGGALDCLAEGEDWAATSGGQQGGACDVATPGRLYTGYSCLGQPTFLGYNASVAMDTIDRLALSSWAFHRRTRAIVAEFALYQPASRLLAVCQVLVELPTTGGGGGGASDLRVRVAQLRDYVNWPAQDAASLVAELVGIVSAIWHAAALLVLAVKSLSSPQLRPATTSSNRFLVVLWPTATLGLSAAGLAALIVRCALIAAARRRLVTATVTASAASGDFATAEAEQVFPALLRAAACAEAFTNLMSVLIFVFSLRLLLCLRSPFAFVTLGRLVGSLAGVTVATALLCTAGTLSLLADAYSGVWGVSGLSAGALPPSFASVLQSLLSSTLQRARPADWKSLGGGRRPLYFAAVAAGLATFFVLKVLTAAFMREWRVSRGWGVPCESQAALSESLLTVTVDWARRLLRKLAPDPRLTSCEDYLPSDEARLVNNFRQISVRLHQLYVCIICTFGEYATYRELAEDLREANRHFCGVGRRRVFASEHPNDALTLEDVNGD